MCGLRRGRVGAGRPFGRCGVSQCTAKSKQSQQRCRRGAAPGASVCCSHGGKAPQTRAAAQRRLVEAGAAKSLAKLGVKVIDDPGAELLAVAEDQRALERYTATWIAELQATDVVDADELRARLDVLRKMQAASARTLADITRLGLAEHRLALDAQRIQIVTELLDRVVTALGHDPADASVRLVLGREIRSLPRVVDAEVVVGD